MLFSQVISNHPMMFCCLIHFLQILFLFPLGCFTGINIEIKCILAFHFRTSHICFVFNQKFNYSVSASPPLSWTTICFILLRLCLSTFMFSSQVSELMIGDSGTVNGVSPVVELPKRPRLSNHFIQIFYEYLYSRYAWLMGHKCILQLFYQMQLPTRLSW